MAHKEKKWAKLSIISLAGGIAVIIALTTAGKGIGTFCNVCPAGFLQITLAGRAMPTGMIFGVAIGIALIYLLGRFFCAWLCPSTFIKKLSGGGKPPKKLWKDSPAILRYSPYIMLSAALAASFIVQFPVFCLICPIGLFFGFIFAVFKLFHVFEPGWNLIIFPALLIAEMVLFRRWCSYICPINGLFKLINKIPMPKKLMLKVDAATCLWANNKNCHVCSTNCPEGLEITADDGCYKEICTSCMICRDKCPTESINYTAGHQKQEVTLRK